MGLLRNARQNAAAEVAQAAAAVANKLTGTQRRLIGEFRRAAKSWPQDWRVFTRQECGQQSTR